MLVDPPLPVPAAPMQQSVEQTPGSFQRGESDGGNSTDGDAEGDSDDEELTSFEQTMDGEDEPTLTRDSADDVALDMDGGDSGFIFVSHSYEDDGIYDSDSSDNESDSEQ
ncbi:hypothetical protein GGX14DRAFT_555545 [Mycena pura]|uniref:Uncharacterized protein n=1 Tax=Mycena pura TaxID=153505 RepID=A0AAD6YQZ5_9AGAR|nr:hypothetical protein GGX14DRAFT_555545 [Mycena pura]